MSTRTTRESVTFRNSFSLGSVDGDLPPGLYNVETDEELLEGLSFTAYRRVRAVIHLPETSGNPLLTRALTIDPDELDAALLRDREAIGALAAIGASSTDRNKSRSADLSPQDRIAVDEAENEGMTRRADPFG